MLRKEPSIETEDEMKANMFYQATLPRVSIRVIGVLALFAGVGARDVRAQVAASPPATAEPGWYGYVPGQGWVRFTAPSAPPVTSGTPTTDVVAAPVPPGWTGYAPATGWVAYAPASSPTFPSSPVTVRPRRLRASDGSLQRAANAAVNRGASQYVFLTSVYREFGTGRRIPLAKPWLPPSP
jgi:hypothetical protein